MERALLAAFLVWSSTALADDGLTPDQQRMRACNTQAKEKQLSGAERSRFMTHCLNGRNGAAPKPTAHQAKNESCTKQADGRALEGAARRGFMSDCVKPDREKQQTAERQKLKNCNHRADGRRLDGEDRKKFVAGCLDGSTVVDG
jgi:hypothetical protein